MLATTAAKRSEFHRFASRRMQGIPRVGSRATDATLEEVMKAGGDVICPKPYPSTLLPAHIMEAAERALKETINPPSCGIPEFRNAVAGVLSHELSINIDPETQVLATSGGMHALFIRNFSGSFRSSFFSRGTPWPM